MQKFKPKKKRVEIFLIKNQQPTNSERNKWTEDMLYYYQESCTSLQGTHNQTPAEHKGISKGILLFYNFFNYTLHI